MELVPNPVIDKNIARLEQEKAAVQQEKEAAEQDKAMLQQEVARLEQEKTELEAKYLAKVKAGEVRKANLAKYRQKHAATRKTLEEEVEEVVASKDKWVPHGASSPATASWATPGKPGGGKRRPDVIHKRIHVMPDTCAHCGADISSSTAHVSHTHVFTDLENLQALTPRSKS